MVFDTDLNRYMMYNGSAWEVVGDGLWSSTATGAYRTGKVGVGSAPHVLANLYVTNASGFGADTSILFVYRPGSFMSTEGGINFTVHGVDAGIKGFADWGNQYSAGIAAYSFLDYNNSTAFVAGKNDGTSLALLGYKDGTSKIWAGHFTGDVRVSGQLGVGISPGSFTNLHSETTTLDRAGYFINNKVTANTTYGIYAGAFGTGSGAKRGGVFECLGGTGTNIAIRALAQGGVVNWSGYFADGNVYVADNVAIGTENMATGYLLSVNGKIISEELRIQDMLDWPDYVFEEEYPLMPLYELEARIQKEKHLPGIPTAAQVSKDGVLVGEMQRLTVEKIEELTLYIIEQQKQMDAQKEEIKKLQELVFSKKKMKDCKQSKTDLK